MRLFLFLLSFVSWIQAGFFPPSVSTTITRIDDDNVTLQKPLPRDGMSALVVHRYKNIEAAIGYVVRIDRTHYRFVNETIIDHDTIPGIKTPPAKGDKVIGGYLYDTVLPIVPDAATLERIRKRYPSKIWLHPDLLASFLSVEGEATPTKENLSKFARTYQVGLFYIVKRDEVVLYDPISGRIVASQPTQSHAKNPKFPFFMRFDKFRTGIFSDSGEGDYYQVTEQFK